MQRFNRFPELAPEFHGLMSMTADPSEEQGGGTSTAAPVSEDEGLSDLDKLKRALEAERRISAENEKARRAAERRYEAVKDLDPETYRKAQERAAEAERIAAEAQQREAEKLREVEGKYGSKLQEAITERDKALAALSTAQQRYALEKVFLAADGLTVVGDDGVSAFDMFWDRLGNRFRIDPADGSLGVVDPNGDWELDPETGKRLKPADFIAKQRDHQLYSFLFKPKFGAGSGMPAGRDVRTAHGTDLTQLNTQEKFAMAFASR